MAFFDGKYLSLLFYKKSKLMTKINVKDTEVTVIKVRNEDYICITDKKE